MWNFCEPLNKVLKDFHMSSIGFEFEGNKYSIEVFENMKAQTGTYLESPGHQSVENKYTVIDIPIEKLFMIDTCVLYTPYEELSVEDGKRYVSLDNIQKAGKEPIEEGCAILVGTGYGKNWDSDDYLTKFWFIKR